MWYPMKGSESGCGALSLHQSKIPVAEFWGVSVGFISSYIKPERLVEFLKVS